MLRQEIEIARLNNNITKMKINKRKMTDEYWGGRGIKEIFQKEMKEVVRGTPTHFEGFQYFKVDT